MAKTFEDWQNLQKKSALPRVIAVFGNEKALIEDAILAVRKRVGDHALVDFNYDKVSAKSESIESILAKANTLPLMANERLVEVHEALAVAAGDLVLFEHYLKTPSQTTVLLLIFDHADVRQKVVKMLDDHGCLYRFDHPKEHELLHLIKERAMRHGLQINAEMVSILAMVVGNDLLLIERALEKLALVCDDKSVIATDIENQVANTRVADAFQLGKAVALGDRKAALESMLKLKEAREVPLRLLGMLAWQLRQVLRARLMLDEGYSEPEIGKTIAAYGDRLRPVMQAARRYSTRAHVARLAKLAEIDRELKSSRASGWLWLERLVMQLCR